MIIKFVLSALVIVVCVILLMTLWACSVVASDADDQSNYP